MVIIQVGGELTSPLTRTPALLAVQEPDDLGEVLLYFLHHLCGVFRCVQSKLCEHSGT